MAKMSKSATHLSARKRGDVNEGWSAILREAMSLAGLKAAHLCRLTGMDSSYVSLMLNKGYVPTRDKVLDMAQVLGVDADVLLLAAGFAPLSLHPDTLLRLLDGGGRKLVPELARALLAMDALDASERGMAVAFLRTYILIISPKRR